MAAFLIVWYHSGVWGSTWAYAGLSIFVILTIQFEFGANYDRQRSVGSLSRTFLRPWALSFALYEIVAVLIGRPILARYDNPVIWLLAGPQIHLWYLPFLFAVSLLAGRVKRMLSADVISIGVAILSLVVLVTIPIWRPWSLVAGAPFIQYCQAVTPVLLGVVIGLRPRAVFGTVSLTLLLGALTIAGFVVPDAPWLVWPHVIGAILVLTVLRVQLPTGRLDVGAVAKYMLGVYLVHPLLIRLAPHRLFTAGPLAALALFLVALILITLLHTAILRAAKQLLPVIAKLGAV